MLAAISSSGHAPAKAPKGRENAFDKSIKDV
jgi:hypothetical protein